MILERLENLLTAATYAQSGEFETARSIMNMKPFDNNATKGGSRMKQEPVKHPSNRYIAPAVGFGAISLSLYAGLLLKEGQVMDFFTRGGWYTVLPVGCAFLFSFVHGAFASNLLSALGIEAKK
jgi:hypothetical protein